MESPGRMPALLYVCILLWVSVQGVDRGNFKTCDQSGFCKRHHNMEAGDSPYRALLDTLDVDPNSLRVEVMNSLNQVRFVLSLSALHGNMARVRITEKEPLVPRYEPPVGDVLLAEPRLDDLTLNKKTADDVTLTFGKTTVVLQAVPLRIDVIADNEVVMSINSRGLLKFEHTRAKENKANEEQPPEEGDQPPQEGEEAAAEEAPAAEEAATPEEPDMWEETFKSHHDSKPNGPQSIGLDFAFPGFEHVYGIPEHAESLALKSTKNTDPYRLYNLDVFEYEVHSPMALYVSVPFMIAHNTKRTVGLFWLNAAETWVDVNSNIADKNMMSKLVDFVKGGDDMPQIDTHWFSESGIIDAFILLGPNPMDVFRQYAQLTGTTPLPPMFAISYHQCRWNYNDQQDVANVDAGFDEHDIPMDVIWLDIEHTNGKRYFTWDQNKFPEPESMLRNISAKGRKMVTVVDPHLKKVSDFKVHQDAEAGGHLVVDKDGSRYDGWCWPGSSSWPDFISPSVREFWAQLFHLDQYVGSTLDLFTWNDMNEPSVFNGPEVSMHKDAKHFGDWEHRDVHNIYGMYVHRATVEGQLLRDPNQRPFVLSRAGFSGSQRYGAIWTGDNTGEWPHLKMSLPMVMSLSIAGVTFSGADVGGFFKNPEPELLLRWYQAGAFQPFFRAHAHHDTRRREPWLMEETILTEISRAIRMRYTYLPYWYTLFYHGEQDGSPAFRPLWVEFPEDTTTFGLDHEHMVGSGLLVHPVTDAGATGVSTYLPGSDTLWYEMNSGNIVNGGQTVYMPVTLSTVPNYQRGGHIIPRKLRRRRASSLMKEDPFTLVVALDKQGSASGDLYVDDYNSFEYRKGNFLHRLFTFTNGKLKSTSGCTGCHYETPEWLERVIILGVHNQPSQVDISSASVNQKLGFKYDSSKKTLEIRKPAVNIGEDFTISIQ